MMDREKEEKVTFEKASNNIFESLGFSPEESKALKLKAEIYGEIVAAVRSQNLNQHAVSKVLDIPQPRVSELLRGKIQGVSIEKLIHYMERLAPDAQIGIYREKRVG